MKMFTYQEPDKDRYSNPLSDDPSTEMICSEFFSTDESEGGRLAKMRRTISKMGRSISVKDRHFVQPYAANEQ